ncbi:MAG: 3,4-dihydroxy-2-butanone-4-phosphate synthase [Chloroflexota bacterium]
MSLATIEEAIADFQQGKMVIIVDDEDRENEGDLVVAADFATPEAINFMAREGCGLICLAMTGPMLDRLGIPIMVPSVQNDSGFGTNFTVSIEAATGVSTGISAFDRARTVQVLIDPNSTPADIAMPGHMFPLRAKPNGVLERRGQTEGSVDLAKLSGLTPASVICEVMNPDGTMARMPQLEQFATEHGLKIISVEQLVAYRLRAERPFVTPELSSQPSLPLVAYVDVARLPTAHGEFDAIAYLDREGREHMLLRMGDLGGEAPPLVRLHSECLTGDVFGSQRCDCGEQLDLALSRIAQQGRGAVLYLRQEGRGIGLANKIRAYALQDKGLDTVEANTHLGLPIDARSYQAAAAMLRDQGITAVRLMTNNPQKIADLEANDIHVVERVVHHAVPHVENVAYLQTKAEKMQHLL